MTRECVYVIIAFTFLAALFFNERGQELHAADIPPQTMLIMRDRQVLGVFDGDLAFRFSVIPEPNAAAKPIIGKTLRFKYTGAFQVIGSDDDEEASPKQNAAIGTFLLVDESKSPPGVGLTKNIADASKWEIDYSRRAPSGSIGSIRQVRADGKMAWLIASSDRTAVTMGGNRFLLAKPILSFTEKEVFTLQYHNGPSGR